MTKNPTRRQCAIQNTLDSLNIVNAADAWTYMEEAVESLQQEVECRNVDEMGLVASALVDIIEWLRVNPE